MPFTTIADGDVKTASYWNTNLRDQTIATVTSATRPSGTNGEVIYETDTKLYQAYDGGWVNFGGLGAWISYTPTLVQSAAVTKTVTYAKYMKLGRSVWFNIRLDVTGTGTANAAVVVGLPVTSAVSNYESMGSGFIFDSSATFTYPGLAVFPTSASTLAFTDAAAVQAINIWLGQTGTSFAAALGNGDVIVVNGMYESAA